MKLNRKMQSEILFALEKVYPDSLLVEELPGFTEEREYMGNLFYLQEHGFIAGGDIREPGRCRSMVDAQITKLGLDFIADDGGLAAILGGETVRLSCQEIVDALLKNIDKDGGSLDDKQRAELQRKLMGKSAIELKKLVIEIIGRSEMGGQGNSCHGTP